MDLCKVCQKPFRRKYRRGGQPQIYCSKSCRYQANYVTKTCSTCAKEFRTNTLSKRKDYCSLACIQRSPCQLCGKIITGRNKFQSGEKRFCNRRCASIVNRTLASKKGYVVRGFAATIRRLGRLACERCFLDNPFGLTVHHIDRDRSNNVEHNLMTLCGYCHAIEHWNQSLKRQRDVLVAQFIAEHT